MQIPNHYCTQLWDSGSESVSGIVNKPLRLFNVDKSPIKAECINYYVTSPLFYSHCFKIGLTVIHDITKNLESTRIVKSVYSILFKFFSDRAVLIWNTKDFNSKERKYVTRYKHFSFKHKSSSIRICESIF